MIMRAIVRTATKPKRSSTTACKMTSRKITFETTLKKMVRT